MEVGLSTMIESWSVTVTNEPNLTALRPVLTKLVPVMVTQVWDLWGPLMGERLVAVGMTA
jgi:hypothetical protein